MSVAILFIMVIGMLLIGVPIAVSLGLSSIIFLLVFSDSSLASVAQTLFSAFEGHFTLLAIPFFILASSFMSTGGVAMRIIRFIDPEGRTRLADDSNNLVYLGGDAIGSGKITLLEGDLYGGLHPAGQADASIIRKLLAPVDPSNIFCIGLNYREHAAESGAPLPERPLVFMKPTSTLRRLRWTRRPMLRPTPRSTLRRRWIRSPDGMMSSPAATRSARAARPTVFLCAMAIPTR